MSHFHHTLFDACFKISTSRNSCWDLEIFIFKKKIVSFCHHTDNRDNGRERNWCRKIRFDCGERKKQKKKSMEPLLLIVVQEVLSLCPLRGNAAVKSAAAGFFFCGSACLCVCLRVVFSESVSKKSFRLGSRPRGRFPLTAAERRGASLGLASSSGSVRRRLASLFPVL